jgi:hypothetical protein
MLSKKGYHRYPFVLIMYTRTYHKREKDVSVLPLPYVNYVYLFMRFT